MIVIIGAGAAGLAAGLRLRAAKVPFLILEARDRIGGRADTIQAGGFNLDLGCEWLHHAEANAWRSRFEAMGLAIDRREAAWSREADTRTLPAADQAEQHRAFEALERRAAEAAEAAQDRPVSDLLEPGGRWSPLLNAFSAAYNGAAFDQISVKDYAAYDDGEANWRVPMGYGAAIALAAEGLPVRLSSPVQRIEHGSRPLRVVGGFGSIEAQAVIVTVPTPHLARGEIAFHPPLPGKEDAAVALPLGCAAKVFLRLDGSEALGPEIVLHTEPYGPRPVSFFLRDGGRPIAELYVGGDLAAELEGEGEAAFEAFAVERLVTALGSAIRPQLKPLAATGWHVDPWARGAYSHARVGRHDARSALAEPAGERLFFAGEAAHPTMFSTAHGAHDTGVAAAEAALAVLTGVAPAAASPRSASTDNK